jgi:hypothetical protein
MRNSADRPVRSLVSEVDILAEWRSVAMPSTQPIAWRWISASMLLSLSHPIVLWFGPAVNVGDV